jgi:hypothetical protein
MKNILTAITALFLCAFSVAQDREELEERFWKDSGATIIKKIIPNGWENESAVILTDDRYYQYINSGTTVYFTSSKHELIKIQDQSSLEGFSEIKLNNDSKVSFLWNTYSKSETIIGIRLIKSDGSVIVVDIEKEEVIEDDIRKIAIPNLEIGDIVDLFLYSKNKEKESDGIEVYPAIETPIKDEYPIVDYRIAMEVENDFFLNMNTYNGAPAVKEEPTDRGATKMYVVEAKNVNKLETKRWYYPLSEEPSVKIQVAFARKNRDENNVPIFKGEDGERKATVTEEDVLDFYDRKFYKVSKRMADDVYNYVDELNLVTKEEKFKAALEWIRFHKNTKFFEGVFAYQAELIGSQPSPRCYDYYFGRFENSTQVINLLRALCLKLDVDYDILMAQPRFDGKMKDLLIKANARTGIRINTPSPLYFFTYDENMTMDRFPDILEGAEVFVGKVEKNKRITSISTEILPVSTADENIYKEDITLSLTDDKKNLKLSRTSEANGHHIDDYIYSWISWVDFLGEDYQQYPEQDHFYDCGRKKEIKNNTASFQSLRDKTKETYLKNREEAAEKEWNATVENYTSEIIQSGRYGSNNALITKESFTIQDNYIKKAGPNYIIEIGKFIGGQVEIDKKERDRKVDIYLDHASKYIYNIELIIPEGYTVKGLDKLNQSIKNATGEFTTTATIEGDTLQLTTIKTYQKNYFKAAEWSQMLPWLDAAFEFNQAKVLLQKI